jgi:hypothetical protein
MPIRGRRQRAAYMASVKPFGEQPSLTEQSTG